MHSGLLHAHNIAHVVFGVAHNVTVARLARARPLRRYLALALCENITDSACMCLPLLIIAIANCKQPAKVLVSSPL